MKQQSFIDEVPEGAVERQHKTALCRKHRYAVNETDLVDVVIKKTGEVVKRCRFCERDKFENKKIKQEDWKQEKEQLTDRYVRHTLATGKNRLKLEEYPMELVQAKKAVIKMNRAVDEAKKPIKTCSQHGDLFRDDVIKQCKNISGETRYKCKACMKQLHKQYYELNKAKVLAKHRTYRIENPELVRESKRKSADKHKWWQKDIDGERAHKRKYEQKNIKEFGDRYVKKQLLKNNGLSAYDLPVELIEAKRAILKLKRGVKLMNVSKTLNFIEGEINGKDKKHNDAS